MNIANCQDGMSIWRELVKNAENTLAKHSLTAEYTKITIVTCIFKIKKTKQGKAKKD